MIDITGSGIPHEFQIKLFVPLEGSVDNAVELCPGQPEAGAYLIFILFGDEITKEQLSVPLNFQLVDNLAHKLGPLLAPELFKLV
jgi:hypothetical protein